MFYTTAPEAYDYPYTVRGDAPVGHMNLMVGEQSIYEVEIPAERLEYQMGRYQSGLYVCLTADELNEQVEVGLASLSD